MAAPIVARCCLMQSKISRLYLKNPIICTTNYLGNISLYSSESSINNNAAETTRQPKIIQPNLRKMIKENNGEKVVKISKAMKAYLERAKKHDEFIKQESEQFEIGRRHLANIMGKDPENFDQDDINEALAYLLPSALFDKLARPIMLPPQAVYPRRKDAEFDMAGRPHNPFFYTMWPNFYTILHESAIKLDKLNDLEDRMISKGQMDPPESDKLSLLGSQWIDKKALEKHILETLKDFQYTEFTSCLSNLANHPYSYKEKEFIFQYRINLPDVTVMSRFNEPIIREDGRRYIEAQGRRKKSTAKITMTDKGSGILKINGTDISYFGHIKEREQVMSPLQFTGYLHRVDIEAELEGDGMSAQAGALRHAISNALASLAPPEERERLRLAGYLTPDFRRRERLKVGQKGARAKYTWLKR